MRRKGWVVLAMGLACWMGMGAGLRPDETVDFLPAPAWRNGGVWETEIVFRVYELESRRLTLRVLREALGLDETLSEAEYAIFEERARPFLADAERGKRPKLAWSGGTVRLPATDRHGFGQARLTLDERLVGGATSRGLRWMEFATAGKGRGPAVVEIQLVAEEGLSVISDIDDTIKTTDVLNRREMLLNTFARPFRAVPGMAEVYRGWGREAKVAFHYLSASPWQLYHPLRAFLEESGFPRGSFHLRQLSWSGSSLAAAVDNPDRFKEPEILALMGRFSRRAFVLVGDSGERDPEIYAVVFRRYPDRVRKILIREVPGADNGPDRWDRAFAGVPADRWQIFREPSAAGRLPEWN